MSANLDWRDHNSRANKEAERYATMRKASSFLRDDNLVWSEDFEAIRYELALAIEAYCIKAQYDNWALEEIAIKLVKDD